LKKKGVSPLYIRVIKDMYKGGRTSVRTPGGVTNDFFVGTGLHQGSASPMTSSWVRACIRVLPYALFSSPYLWMNLQEGFKMSYLDVCYLQVTFFSLMRPDRELMSSWSDGGIHWNLGVSE